MSAVDILGVRVDNVTAQETLARMAGWIAAREAHQVVTVNPEFVMRAQRDAAFRVVLHEATLALPDGYGLLWAAKVLRRPLRERVAGSDLVPLAAKLAAQRGYRLFLLGAAPGVAERAARVLIDNNPGLSIAGTYAGSPAVAEEDALVARIRRAAPDMLFVAYGAPGQDLWIARNLARLGVPVCMGIGGTLDFVAGVVQRAPVWMRNAGIEWLFRLWQEPRRWRRMTALPRFVLAVWRQSLLGAGRG